MIDKRKKLYFIDGNVPTAEDRAKAAALDIEAFRNARKVVPGAPLEKADVVAGAVPAGYAQLKGVEVIVPKVEPEKQPEKQPEKEPDPTKPDPPKVEPTPAKVKPGK